jgi:hypothetical protein
MGCDIHMNVEVRRNGRWQFVQPPEPCGVPECWMLAHATKSGYDHTPHWWSDRNYSVFAALSGVRADEGDPAPISEPRGYPKDADPVTLYDHPYGEPFSEINKGQDHGDHSATWLGLDEVLDHDWSQTYYEHGIVTVEEFARCLEQKCNPDSWCGGVGGKGVTILTPIEAKRWLRSGRGKLYMLDSMVNGVSHLWYVNMRWKVTLRDRCRFFCEWAESLPERLDAKPEDIRLVFSFDS